MYEYWLSSRGGGHFGSLSIQLHRKLVARHFFRQFCVLTSNSFSFFSIETLTVALVNAI